MIKIKHRNNSYTIKNEYRKRINKALDSANNKLIIDVKNEDCIYVSMSIYDPIKNKMDKMTYYIDMSTGENIIDKWKTGEDINRDPRTAGDEEDEE